MTNLNLNVKIYLKDEEFPINMTVTHDVFSSWLDLRCVYLKRRREGTVYIPFERVKEIIVEDKL